MKKSRSVVLIIVALVVTIAMCLVSYLGIGPGKVGSVSNITLGLDLRGGVSVTYQVTDDSFTEEELSDTIYKLQLRVAEYSADASVYQEGTDRITVEIPGVYDTETVIEELGRPGSLYFIKETDEDGEENYSYSSTDGTYVLNKTIEELQEAGDIIMSGNDVDDAQAGYQSDDYGSQEVIVKLTLNDTAKEAFAEATADAYAAGETIAIYYDEEFVSVPTVSAEITDGVAIITGEETLESAQNLASTIRIGSLSLNLEEITSKVVSAKLGDNAVSTSLIAGLIGLLLIIILMICIYRIPGVSAAIAMIFYAASLLLLMNAFDLTLTVSGIAGIILSIGMAVDGNVIINARIKEEIAAGKPVEQSIKLGFKKSTSAILDGNITTLIVAIVLLIFGSGTVRGFGMTLAIGIVMSVITSLLVSRLFVYAFYGIGIKDRKFYAPAKKKAKKIFDFVGKKTIWFIIAIVCILAGVVTMIVNGASGNGALNFSTEFVGGVSTTVDFGDNSYDINKFNDEIKPSIAEIIGSTDIEGQPVTGSNQYVIKTPEMTQEQITELKNMLVETYGADEDGFEITSISAIVSSELLRDAYISLIIAAALMLIYIWIRFRKLKFAISSVIALLHDVMIVVAFFAIFRLSVGNSFIACILTIVGYSINATIVIFDRIRENLADQFLNYDLKKVVNTSIQQTLSRSIFTSLTTFIVVLFLYILGVESMRAFALPLAVGIVAGAFSSVLISGNLFYIMTKKKDRYNEKAARIATKQAEIQGVEIAEGAETSAEEISEISKEKPGEATKITANPNHKKKKDRQ